MNLKDQTFFFKRLAFLSNAHIPLSEGLLVLSQQSTSKKQIKIFERILADVGEGQSLSRAFSKFPKVFNEFCLSIVTVGESSGTLSKSFEYLAIELAKKQALRSKVVGAFIYPAVITAATLGITAFLVLFLFPKITPIFKSLRAHLPLSTRIVMGASNFLEHYGILLIVGITLVTLVIIFAFKRSTRFRLLFDHALLRLPLLGSIVQIYTLANSCRTLGLLLSSGVDLARAVLITAEATPNLVYKGEFKSLESVVVRGEQLSMYLTSRQKLFPPLLTHMVAVGERSGTLSETCLYMAGAYDIEVDEFTKNISTLIEPALMVVMGIVVGFIAISIITPIYAITQNLHT